MKQPAKIVLIAASLAVGYLPVIASAQVHSHPSRAVLSDMSHQSAVADGTEGRSTEDQNNSRSIEPASCDAAKCGPLLIYGIGY